MTDASTSSVNFASPAVPDEFQPEVIVVGAGVVGAAIAFALGTDGRRVLVLEKDMRRPERIVGELMQPGGVLRLTQLGLAQAVENIDAAVIGGYAVLRGDERVVLPYACATRTEEFAADATGRAFHHGLFVDNLRSLMRSVASVKVIEAIVTGLNFDETHQRVTGVRYRFSGTTETFDASAPLVLVVDGLYSSLRKSLVSQEPHSRSAFHGLILHNAMLPYPGFGHVLLVQPSPVLMYPISSNEVRVLVDIPKEQLEQVGGDVRQFLETITAPQLPVEVRETFIDELQRSKVSGVACTRLHPEPVRMHGAVLLGDAWNVRHPLTGAGMTVGLSDALLLRDLLRRLPSLEDERAMDELMNEFYSKRQPRAGCINVLAQALYEVFSGTVDPSLPDACFSYFKLGGACVSEPMGLLSCMRPSRWTLFYHFFRVGIYGSLRQLWPIPWPFKIIAAVRSLWRAAFILLPLMRNEHFASLSYPSR